MKLHAPILFLDGRPNPVAASLAVPLVGTKGYRTLLDWFSRMNVDVNSASTRYFFGGGFEGVDLHTTKIITLGPEAAFQFSQYNTQHLFPIPSFSLPHPADAAQKDSEELGRLLSRCKRFIYSSPVK